MQFLKSDVCMFGESPVSWVFHPLLVSGSSYDVKTSYANLNEQKTDSKQIKLK